MKKNALILFISLVYLSLPSLSFSQVNIIWQHCLGGSSTEEANCILPTSDGGYIAIGVTWSSDFDVTGNNGGKDFWVVKFDNLGKIEWKKCYGNQEFDAGEEIDQTSDGGYILVGSAQNIDISVHSDVRLIKIDSLGNVEWTNNYGGSSNDYGRTVKQTSDGGYIIGGEANSEDINVPVYHGDTEYYVIKTDAQGNLQWQKCFGGSAMDKLFNIDLTYDGGYILSGISTSVDGDIHSSHGSAETWVVKIDSVGEIQWQRCVGGKDWESWGCARQTSDNGYIVATQANQDDFWLSDHNGFVDAYVVKLDSLGTVVWQKCYGGTSADGAKDIQQTSDGGYVFTGMSQSINNGVIGNHYFSTDAWVVKIDSIGNMQWNKCFGGYDSDYAYSVIEAEDGAYVFAGYTRSEDGDITGLHRYSDFWVVKIKEQNIYGQVFYDYNQNCIRDSMENGVASHKILVNPGNYILQTNSLGEYFIDSLPVGIYTATIDTSNLLLSPTCPSIQTFEVTDPNSITLAPTFGLVQIEGCADPQVEIFMPWLRPGFSDLGIYVLAQNTFNARSVIDSAWVDVKLHSLITVEDATLPYYMVGDNTYRFQLGSLYPGQRKDFVISAELNASAVIGQTICLEAEFFPVDSCIFDFDTIPDDVFGGVSPCNLPWDHSSLSVEGFCQNDTVVFAVTNTGDPGEGDMQCYSAVRIYVDAVLMQLDSVKLTGGQTIQFIFAGTGQTWRLEVDQHPLHPGNSHPNAVVELCGDQANWTPDMVNVQYLDNSDPIKDIFCVSVSGSFDPNDKTGYPTGVGTGHNIKPNQELKYIIRFQNTGTDTAFNIVIRDTLNQNFDFNSVVQGMSSHSCSFSNKGNGILEWTFTDILLPDSTTNETKSHGFVSFEVLPKSDLPYGTVLNNSAAIYFDFNEPVITNKTVHTIFDFSSEFVYPYPFIGSDDDISIYPNPSADMISVVFAELEEESKLTIFNMNGRKVSELNLEQGMIGYNIFIDNYPSGMYFVVLSNSQKCSVVKFIRK